MPVVQFRFFIIRCPWCFWSQMIPILICGWENTSVWCYQQQHNKLYLKCTHNQVGEGTLQFWHVCAKVAGHPVCQEIMIIQKQVFDCNNRQNRNLSQTQNGKVWWLAINVHLHLRIHTCDMWWLVHYLVIRIGVVILSFFIVIVPSFTTSSFRSSCQWLCLYSKQTKWWMGWDITDLF